MDKLPVNLQHPGGFVEYTMNHINDTATCPQPLFALGAALTLAGTLYGRHVQSADGQRTNLFTMSIGYTSCGKDHALKSIARILDAGDATHLRIGQVTSDSAIEWGLKRQPRMCLVIDEAGHFFAGANDSKNKGAPQRSIKPALLELWSSANKRWIGKQRVPKDGKTEVEPLIIDSPHLCLYSTSQPQILFDNLSREDLRDGWLARNLFFISTTRPKPVVKAMTDVPNKIIGEVQRYREEDKLVTVPTTPEAEKIFADFGERVYNRMLIADKSGDETNYLYGKAGENARRIALILAVSRVWESQKGLFAAEIGTVDATYATELVEFLVGTMIEQSDLSIADNADEKAKKKMVKIIAKAGANGMTRNELTRKTQWVRRNMREEYINDLIDAKEITKPIPFTDGHGHGERFFITEFAPRQAS